MPQLQIVDTTERAPEPTGVQQFFSNLVQSYKDRSDKREMDSLINEYRQNTKDLSAWENLQLGLEQSNISPSKRLETQKHLNEMQKIVVGRDKALNAKTAQLQKDKEVTDKAVKDQKETEAILLNAGYDPDEAANQSKVLTPQSALKIVSNKQEGREYSNLREKSISEYVNTSLESAESAQGQKFAIEEARKAVKGDVTGPGFTALVKNNPYTQLIFGLTPDEAALQAANKKLLEGSKGLFGAKPTEREIFLLLNEMLPSIGKSKEANEAGLDFIEKINDLKLAQSQLVEKLTNGGSKYVPNIQSKVNEQMKPLYEALKTELEEANKKFNSPDKKDDKGTKYKAPDGSLWSMTKEQVDAAKAKGVIFEPAE